MAKIIEVSDGAASLIREKQIDLMKETDKNVTVKQAVDALLKITK